LTFAPPVGRLHAPHGPGVRPARSAQPAQ
jgi:hypothetical protein